MVRILKKLAADKNGRIDLHGHQQKVAFALLLALLGLASPIAAQSTLAPGSSLQKAGDAIDQFRQAHPANRDTDLQSLERDRQSGALLSRAIDAQNELVTDPQVLDYLNRLGQSLINHSLLSMPFAVTIKIIKHDKIEAFTLPGGYIYVSSGLILASNSEAEVAGVLAHEIAHIAARHDPRMQRLRRNWSIAAHCSGPAGVAVQFAGLLSSMKASRDAEREADFLGIRYLVAAGYNPKGFVDFLKTPELAENDEGRGLFAGTLATHPILEERTARADREISALLLQGSEQLALDTEEFEEMRLRIADVLSYASEEEMSSETP